MRHREGHQRVSKTFPVQWRKGTPVQAVQDREAAVSAKSRERESDLAGSQATGSRDLPAKPLGGSLLPDPAPFMGGLLSECPEIEEDTGIKDTKEIYMLDLDLSDYTAQYPEVQEELAAAAHVHIRSMKDQAFYYIVRGLKEDKSNGGESH